MNNQQWQECWMDLGSWNQTCPNLGARNARFSAGFWCERKLTKLTQLDQLNDLLEIHGPHQSLFFFSFFEKIVIFLWFELSPRRFTGADNAPYRCFQANYMLILLRAAGLHFLVFTIPGAYGQPCDLTIGPDCKPSNDRTGQHMILILRGSDQRCWFFLTEVLDGSLEYRNQTFLLDSEESYWHS